jgi:hypothetical protein
VLRGLAERFTFGGGAPVAGGAPVGGGLGGLGGAVGGLDEGTALGATQLARALAQVGPAPPPAPRGPARALRGQASDRASGARAGAALTRARRGGARQAHELSEAERVLRVEALQELGFGPAEARAALAEAAGNLEVAAALLVESREARADPGG